MNKLPQIWRIIVPVLIGLLLCSFVAVVWNSFFHGLSVVMSDGTEFEYDHNLTRGYESKTISNVAVLQVVAIAYAQQHKGALPPMQTSGAAFSALRVGLGEKAKHFSRTQRRKDRLCRTRRCRVKKWGACQTVVRRYYFTMPTRRRATAKATM